MFFATVSGKRLLTQLQRFRSQGHRGADQDICLHGENRTLTFRQGVRTKSASAPRSEAKSTRRELGFIVERVRRGLSTILEMGLETPERRVLLQRTRDPRHSGLCIPQSTLELREKCMDDATLHRWGKPDTILVATNLLDAPHIGPHVIAQARLSGAKVLLVHVIQPSYLPMNPTEAIPFVLPSPTLRSVQGRLNKIVKELQYEGVPCEPIVLKGLHGEQIPALIDERRVDRVIVGTRGAAALDRILLGAVADDLSHQVDVPVCVVGPHVRPQASSNRKPTSILVATSFRSQRPPSVQLAVELAALYHAHLTWLHVVSEEHTEPQAQPRESAPRLE